MIHKIHKAFSIRGMDKQMISRSYLMFDVAFSLIFESLRMSITSSFLTVESIRLILVCLLLSSLLFLTLLSRSVSKLSKIIGSNRFFYHILDRLYYVKCTWISRVVFFHNDFLDHSFLFLMK